MCSFPNKGSLQRQRKCLLQVQVVRGVGKAARRGKTFQSGKVLGVNERENSQDLPTVPSMIYRVLKRRILDVQHCFNNNEAARPPVVASRPHRDRRTFAYQDLPVKVRDKLNWGRSSSTRWRLVGGILLRLCRKKSRYSEVN